MFPGDSICILGMKPLTLFSELRLRLTPVRCSSKQSIKYLYINRGNYFHTNYAKCDKILWVMIKLRTQLISINGSITHKHIHRDQRALNYFNKHVQFNELRCLSKIPFIIVPSITELSSNFITFVIGILVIISL